MTVMDDREDFVTSERFPDADRLIKGSYDKLQTKYRPMKMLIM